MRTFRSRQRGAAILLAIVMLTVVLLGALALRASTRSLHEERERLSERALAQAREALLAYASGHPINSAVGPGYLPCPDLDNDGWAESTCGSLAGDTGQQQRLGRLPWKTLGLPDLRDGHGERLWYAVSTKYKGLLNCGASRACVDMAPASALGTITVRDASGLVLHDGTLADPSRAAAGGAAAVVFAPGTALDRRGVLQRRECAFPECDANGVCVLSPPQRAAACDPANYLDLAQGIAGGDEDNATFVDRSDAAGRALNRDGFVQGPVATSSAVLVNDRLAVLTYGDVMPRVMRRVALEVASCLRAYASRTENASRYPWTAAACADARSPMHESMGAVEGRVADTPFDAAAGAGLLPRWWRTQSRSPESLSELPTRDDACRIAIPPDDAGPLRTLPAGSTSDEATTAGLSSPSWWSTWKAHVTIAIAPGFTPASLPHPACDAQACFEVAAAGGRVITARASAVIAVRGAPSACSFPISRCDASGCRATVAAGDAVAWLT
jgi:hypothetical protein